MQTKTVRQEKAFQIVRKNDAIFRATIVGKYTMSSSLIADALMRDLKCESVETRPSDLLQTLATTNIDLVIITADITSRQGSGFELAKAVSMEYPNLPTVILIDEPTRETTIKALRAGARGVFNRQMSLSQFIDCVEHVRNGFIWAGPEETTFLLEAIRNVPGAGEVSDSNLQTLTARELQVVRSAASGKTNRAIASELNLSEHTIKNYLFRSFEKLGVSSRVELLFYLTMRGHTFNSTNAAQEGTTSAN
jgi:DNA-binding NarL/FixJ family response regulator